MNSRKKSIDNEYTIDIGALLGSLLKRIWLIVLVTVIFAGGSFILAKFIIPPTYRSGFTAYVNNAQASSDKDYLSSSDIMASKELVQTYSKILTSNTVLMNSAKNVPQLGSYSFSELNDMVSTEIVNGTEIVRVYVKSGDSQLAYDFAKAIAERAPEDMATIIEGSSMKIVDSPQMPTGVYEPSSIKYTIVGGVIGLLLVVGVLVIIFFTNDMITSEAELERRYSIPVIGIIPDATLAASNNSRYYQSDYGYESAQSEDCSIKP